MERVSLTIGGMSCGHCVKAVSRALEGLPGVRVEQVSVGSAVLAYDGEAVTPAQVEEALSDEGYRVLGIGRAS